MKRAWLAVLLVLLGCNSRHKDSLPAPPPVVCQDLEFQGALATPADGDVFLHEESASCTTVDVGVMVNSLTGIWTVGFDLVFPPAVVRFDGATVGPLLQQGSPTNPPALIVNSTSSEIQVSVSRLHPDPSVAAVGAVEVVHLRFSRVAAGSGVIDFDASSGSTVAETILDDSGNPRPASFGPGHGGLVTAL